MCTLTWISGPESYELHFNRDERRARLPAEPPARHGSAAGAFLAPRDGEEGGTWISVNAAGLALALLNRYQDRAEPTAPVSRGTLVFELAPLPELTDVTRALQARNLKAFRPFELAVFAPGVCPWVHRWDGRGLGSRALDDAEMPLASSGFDHDGARRLRRETLSRTLAGDVPDARRLAAFHRSHDPRKGAYSVCMHRPDAATVSYSRVRVGREDALFEYQPGPPCQDAPVTRLRLERSEAGGSGK